MRHFRRTRVIHTKGRMVIALLLLSVVFMLLPRSITGRLLGLVQVMVPLQDAASSATSSVSDAFSDSALELSPEQSRAIVMENQALKNRLASSAARVEHLEQENKRLTAIRSQLSGDDGAVHGSLIPARVITGDMFTWRDSQLLRAGTLRGVSNDDPVVSQYFTVERGTQDGLSNGMAVLLSEVLVGIVENTSTHTARVRLLSDVESQMPVRVWRPNDGEADRKVESFWLWGAGNGMMEIRDVPNEVVERGDVAIGDVVLSDEMEDGLPIGMVIGNITAIEPDRRNPLLSVLTVKPPMNTRALRRVYVFDPGDEPSP